MYRAKTVFQKLKPPGSKPDKFKTLFEMVQGYNYTIEKYLYCTKDGYINSVFRIKGPAGTPVTEEVSGKPVVIY